MLIIGPLSSIYDFVTFYALLAVFHADAALFQTGWFVESLATQTLVIFVIRTMKNPLKSRPSLPLALTSIGVVVVGVALPFSPLGPLLGFVPLPPMFFAFLVGVVVTYLMLVEVVKRALRKRLGFVLAAAP
jgi:Mg2+-importing ATPase